MVAPRDAILLIAVGALALAGCQPKADSAAWLASIGPQDWRPMESVGYRIEMQKLGEVPNSGLLLPAVSPDGRWIACLQTPPTARLDFKALMTGAGCEENRLLLRPTNSLGDFKAVCLSGTTWLGWSADSSQLIFVARGEGGRGELGIHDVATSVTRRIAVGPRHITMPAISPDGGRIAVVDTESLPASSRIYVLNLADRQLTPGPPLKDGCRQLWPMWVDDETIVYLNWGPTDAWLCEWTIGGEAVRWICQFGDVTWVDSAAQLFAPVPRPLRPDGQAIAYYDAFQDRITLVDTSDGGRRRQDPRTRAGCWMGTSFAAASDKGLFLRTAETTTRGDRVLKGQWLPIWADADSREMILASPGGDDYSFALTRIRLLQRN